MTSTIDQGLDPLAALSAASHAAPGLDPNTTAAVAKSSSDPAEVVAKAQATFHFGNTVQAYDQLHTMSPSQQASAWTGMSGSQQDALRSVGYQPPRLEALSHSGGGGGILGSIWHGITTGGTALLHVVEKPFTDVLRLDNEGLSAVQHVARAAEYETDKTAMGMGIKDPSSQSFFSLNSLKMLTSPSAWKAAFSPADWAQGWRATMNGNTSILPSARRQLVSENGTQAVDMAIRVAGSSADAVVQQAPQAQRQQLTRLFQEPKFQALVQQVKNSRMSMGQAAVGTAFLNNDPGLAHVISGGIDATYDWFADPINAAGAIVKAARVAKWGLSGDEAAAHVAGEASQADALLNSGAFKRWTEYVGKKYLENGDYAGLARFDPRFDSIAGQLSSEGIDSAEKLRDWFSGQAGLSQFLNGNAARISQGISIVPHLTALGWAKAGVKDILQRYVVDAGADAGLKSEAATIALDPANVANGTGKAATLEHLMNQGELAGAPGRLRRFGNLINVPRLIRRMTTLGPTERSIGIVDGDLDVANFRRFVQGFLPARRVDDVVNAFISGDEGSRWRLVQAARAQMFHTLGLYNTAEGAEAGDQLLAAYAEAERRSEYSVGGIDDLADDSGLMTPSAILENQVSPRISIPDVNEMRRIVQQYGRVSALGVAPMKMADYVMGLWRMGILARPGFALRFSLDENLGRLLRSDPKQFIGSYLANSLARAAVKHPNDLDINQLERTLSMLGQEVPKGILEKVDSPSKFWGSIVGNYTHRWAQAAKAGGLKVLGKEEYINAATHLYTHQPVMDGFADLISSIHGAPGDTWAPKSQLQALLDNGSAEIARFAKRAEFSEATLGQPLYALKWQYALDGIAGSRLGRAALENLDQPEREQVQRVLDALHSEDFAPFKSRFARNKRLPDGRVVGVDATQAEADQAWARTVVRHVNAHLKTADGRTLSDLRDEMLATGAAPNIESIERHLGAGGVPPHVYGPDVLVTTNESKGLGSFLSKSMEKLVGKPADWMTRQPHFIQKYAEALKQTRPLAERMNPAGSEQLASDLAFQRATNDIIPYIHNPKLRTQFEASHRILFPFLFAQRQFLQRWGRTFLDSPDAIRKIQLTMNGLRTSGFLKKDQNGQDYFYYPFTQYAQELATGVLGKLGVHMSLPLVVPFTGQVQYLMPGLDNPVTPSVGPFASIAVKELAKMFPELNSVSQSLLGQGASTAAWQDFVPSIVSRLYEALGPTETGSELASTTMSAIKLLDATDHGLPDNATNTQVEQYANRVQQWARSLLVVRAALGFVLPSTPSAQFDTLGLDSRLQTLLSEMPYDQAVAEFIREHPDATAYTVSESQNATDGITPATTASLTWLNQNLPFAQAHPLAAGWLVPRTGTDFNPAAYREQIAVGMRNPKDVPTFLRDVVMARASNAYYQTYDEYNKAYDATTDSSEHQQLAHIWDTWKASFDQRNPLFAQYLASNAGHVDRLQTIQDMTEALAAQDVPDSPQVPQLRTILGNFEAFQYAYTRYAGLYDSSSSSAKDGLKAQITAWGTTYAKQHPDVADFWNTVIRPEIEETSG